MKIRRVVVSDRSETEAEMPRTFVRALLFAEPSARILPEDKFAYDSVVPRWLWISILLAFLSANIPPSYAVSFFMRVLRLPIFRTASEGVERVEYLATTFTYNVIVPLEELIFVLCLVCMAYPLVKCVIRSGVWLNLNFKRIATISLLLFAALSVLVFPYSYPRGLNSHVSGLSGLGMSFANMSDEPFEELDPLYYKRVLKPELAHLMHLHGFIAYYVFSLILTFVLIFLLVSLFETKFRVANDDGGLLARPGIRWLTYLSLMTSSFVIVDFQWPGYSDGLSFILMLLIILVPLNFPARLATVSLAVLNHEAIALALVPLILFAFPRKERAWLLAPFVMFYGMMIGGAGFSLLNWLQGQGSVRSTESESVWLTVLQEPGLLLAGWFYAYKLFWLLLGLVLFTLWRRADRTTLAGLAVVTLFPLALTAFAWDTSRVAGFGWLGMVMIVGMFLKESSGLSNAVQYSALALICANLLIPTYNVVIYYRNSLLSYPYPGLYMALDSVVRRIAS